MADLVVVTPSRGRPRQLNELVHAVGETTAGRVEVIGLVDDDDPQRAAYKALFACDIWTGPRRSLVAWTNFCAAILLDAPAGDRPRYLASLGDDHRPRTRDWDRMLIDAIEDLDGPGFAYGNDLFQGPRMPTSWVVSADVVDAVDWMMLPACEHLFVDAAVLALGRAAERIVYCPSVVIEHMHPIAGKADWDESYRASNARGRYAADEAAYQAWLRGGLDADARKIRTLHGRRPMDVEQTQQPQAEPYVNRFELTITAEADVVKAPQPADGPGR